MEQWKDIPDYEGIYQASNLGRIRTTPLKTTHTKKHGVRHWQTRILKTRGKHSSGYRASLWKNGQPKDFLVARLVATTWVDGYQEGFTVNHKNGNRFDNRVKNLEWLSLADNIRHGFNTGLYPTKAITLIENTTGKKMKFKSMADASTYIGRNKGYISNCIRKGKNIICGQYEIEAS